MKHDDNDYHKKKRPRTKIQFEVTDNIPEGQELRINGKEVFSLFQKEIMEKFCKHSDGTPYIHPESIEKIENLKNKDSDDKKALM